MKKILLFLLFLQFTISGKLFAQLEKVSVETYYISDANDSTDVIAGRMLPMGSKTYRIFVDLKQGCKIKKIFGNAAHTLKITSTADFYNNVDRPSAYFGYLINKSWFPDNPTLALDSWLTLGLATKTNSGVLKSDDSDGSFIGGSNNYGGSAAIASGLLANADPTAGVPITTADGMAPSSGVLGQWIDYGFKDFANVDTTVFGSVASGSSFISNNTYLQQNSGVSGDNLTGNKVLVAQLTTIGDIAFELNFEVQDSLGNSTNYIAKGQNSAAGDTIVSPFLVYPPSCGCTDARYLEYSAAYACGVNDSCKTLIKFGCTDPMACNFDAEANFNVPLLCCYPGYCNDRNIGLVCPGLSNGRFDISDVNVYPNPATEQINLDLNAGKSADVELSICDAFGKQVYKKNLGSISGNYKEPVNVGGFSSGIYVIHFSVDGESFNTTFFKQ